MKIKSIPLLTPIIAILFLAPAHGQRHLLVNQDIIGNLDNVRLVPGQVSKSPHNPLFHQEHPWEPRYDNGYGNVLWDKEAGIYKLWYSPFTKFEVNLVESTSQHLEHVRRTMGVCYATSVDGIHWEKRISSEFLWEGQPSNVLFENWSNMGIMKDNRDPDPQRRYKGIFRNEHIYVHSSLKTGTKMTPAISVAFSPDGLHWSDAHRIPNADLAGDTHSNAIWAPTLGKYVAITRDRIESGPGVRVRAVTL